MKAMNLKVTMLAHARESLHMLQTTLDVHLNACGRRW